LTLEYRLQDAESAGSGAGAGDYRDILMRKPPLTPVRIYGRSKIKPYVKLRNLADPFGDRKLDCSDIDVGSDSATAAEIGIRISF